MQEGSASSLSLRLRALRERLVTYRLADDVSRGWLTQCCSLSLEGLVTCKLADDISRCWLIHCCSQAAVDVADTFVLKCKEHAERMEMGQVASLSLSLCRFPFLSHARAHARFLSLYILLYLLISLSRSLSLSLTLSLSLSLSLALSLSRALSRAFPRPLSHALSLSLAFPLSLSFSLRQFQAQQQGYVRAPPNGIGYETPLLSIFLLSTVLLPLHVAQTKSNRYGRTA